MALVVINKDSKNPIDVPDTYSVDIYMKNNKYILQILEDKNMIMIMQEKGNLALLPFASNAIVLVILDRPEVPSEN